MATDPSVAFLAFLREESFASCERRRGLGMGGGGIQETRRAKPRCAGPEAYFTPGLIP